MCSVPNEAGQKCAHILRIEPDIFTDIFKFLSFEEAVRTAATCKGLNVVRLSRRRDEGEEDVFVRSVLLNDVVDLGEIDMSLDVDPLGVHRWLELWSRQMHIFQTFIPPARYVCIIVAACSGLLLSCSVSL
jgi:hypothetical protein